MHGECTVNARQRNSSCDCDAVSTTAIQLAIARKGAGEVVVVDSRSGSSSGNPHRANGVVHSLLEPSSERHHLKERVGRKCGKWAAQVLAAFVAKRLQKVLKRQDHDRWSPQDLMLGDGRSVQVLSLLAGNGRGQSISYTFRTAWR